MKDFALASNNKSDPLLYDLIVNSNQDNQDNPLIFLAPNRLKDLRNFFENQSEISSDNEIEKLQNLWRDILVDAIYFLRINDFREKAFSYNDNGKKVKTTMRTPGVEGVALLNVYGIDELFKYFKQFAKFENTLYGADKFYRDHLIHPIWVWIIGIHIIKEFGHLFNLRVCDRITIKSSQHAEKGWFNNPEELYISTAELSAMWAIIALTHDLGYPLEKVEKINDQLETMLSQFGKIKFSRSRFNFETQHDHLVKFLLNFISSVAKINKVKTNRTWIQCLISKFLSATEIKEPKTSKKIWITHKRTKYFTKFAKSWEMFDHGIVSCLILLKALTFFIESDHSSDYIEKLGNEDARQFSIRSEILHAIASHTTPKIYHLATNNLPFLLILCDDLQEWSRPTLGDMRVGIKGSANSVVIEKCEIEKSDTHNGVIKSTIHCKIQYEAVDFDDQERFAKRVFLVWYERFRPALDDKQRVIDFSWKLKFGDSQDWHMHLDTGRDVHHPFCFKGPDKTDPENSQKEFPLMTNNDSNDPENSQKEFPLMANNASKE